jgi:hypothetical protein
MAEKATCDACGKQVGVLSLWRRIGFTPGSRVGRVCGACYRDKLSRDERLRFARPAARRKKGGEEALEAERPGASSPPDELRFGP